MKKVVITAVAALFAGNVMAQMYMTRTGKITFFSSTPIENIEAFNNEAAAVLNTSSNEVAFKVPVKSFKFEKQLMQDHFNESYMESDKYPKAEFTGKITNPGDINFSKDGSYKATVSGKMTIHGVTQDVTIPGTVTVKGSEITINSKFMVRTADYKIKIPAMAASKIAKEIEVTVNTVLKQK